MSYCYTLIKDFKKFYPAEFFQHDEYWQEYGNSKDYIAEYKRNHPNKNHINYKIDYWTIASRLDSQEKHYVVINEVYDEAELQQLKQYCKCRRCTMWTINPIKYITCPCCVGCIDSENPQPKYVKKARIDMANETKC